MRRRDFIVGGMSMAGILAARLAGGRPPASNRAAVVIGVDKVGDLPKLKAAASGAAEVGDWLKAEGFDVKRCIDDRNPVHISDVKAAIRALVNSGTLDQLVIYFAGHGFVNSFSSELWLLSDARSDPNEAISLTECRDRSRMFGIPNVVFISDACRSRASDLQTVAIQGSVIFPTPTRTGETATEVDKFLATRIGDPAWEVSTVGDSTAAAKGIYTACLLEAFKHPYATMVQTVDGKPVIPNRRLKSYLAKEVPKRAQAAFITLVQIPDAEICSDEPTYIGHVSTSERLPAVTLTTPTLADVASTAIGVTIGGGAPHSDPAITALATASGYTAATDSIFRARGLSSELSARTGFVIGGQVVKSVTARPGIETNVRNAQAGERSSAVVGVNVGNARGASVALRFGDDSGTIIAALDGFVGTVVVDKGGVASVSYVPSRSSERWSYYETEAGHLEELRAQVATAARFGVFRIEGPRATRNTTADQFAGRIRVLKGIDPTLGVYAAYAYANGGLVTKVRSVRDNMRGDLGLDLFDVLMLTGQISGRAPGDFGGTSGAYPFCPMLSQGWGLLRVREIRLPEVVAAMRDHLRPSLWITVDPDGMSIAEAALRSDRVR